MKISFRANKDMIDCLFQCNQVAGEVQNSCLELAKEHHLKTEKWIAKSALQKCTKEIFSIQSQSVQVVCHNSLFAPNEENKARKAGYKNKYPHKQKKYFNTKCANNGFTIFENGKIELFRGNFKGKRLAILNVWINEVPTGQIKEIELILIGNSCCQSLMKTVKQSKSMLLKTVQPLMLAKNGEHVIITERKIGLIYRLYNKKLAELQRKMSQCTKGICYQKNGRSVVFRCRWGSAQYIPPQKEKGSPTYNIESIYGLPKYRKQQMELIPVIDHKRGVSPTCLVGTLQWMQQEPPTSKTVCFMWQEVQLPINEACWSLGTFQIVGLPLYP